MKNSLYYFLLVTIMGSSGCGGGRPDFPEPGSGAAEYCDTNETGPGYVKLANGEWYDKKCLEVYSWKAE